MSKSPLFNAQLREIPKVELHRHLDCSMRWSTMQELAPLLGLEMPKDPTKSREAFLIVQPMQNLKEVLQKFMQAQKLLASEEILSRLAYEACEDAVNEGIRILELRYAPTFITEGHPELNFSKIHQAFCRGIKMAQKRWPLAVGLICIIQRNLDVPTAEKVCQFAIENKDTFVGIDLADNEDTFDLQKFAFIFEKAKKAGLRITVHSGETPHAQAAEWVKQSVLQLGAERIGHGIQVIRDPSTIDFLIEKKIPLEVCPYSNWLTQAFPTHLDHPLRKLKNHGVFVTLNSDDPGIFSSQLIDDYQMAQTYHGFSGEEFEQMNDWAAYFSFIPRTEKQKVWPRKILEKI